ncbi:MAG: addiction module protein [Gallionella sp.]
MGKQEIVAQALKLDPAERFDLVDQILHSLDKPDPVIDRVWLEEAEKQRSGLPPIEQEKLKAYRQKRFSGNSDASGILARSEAGI